MIVIIDYGVGNLTSIKNMIRKAGGDAIISSAREDFESATKFILPGIGSFDYGIRSLRNSNYFSILEERVLSKGVPVLGVCLGVQLFFEKSEEGDMSGLNWISGNVIRFDEVALNKKGLKIPHMGWTDISIMKSSRLLEGMYPEPRFYFVHSYHVVCSNPSDILVEANYGYDFVAGVEHKNIIGLQFHPEKSHKFGMKIYENFLKYY